MSHSRSRRSRSGRPWTVCPRKFRHTRSNRQNKSHLRQRRKRQPDKSYRWRRHSRRSRSWLRWSAHPRTLRRNRADPCRNYSSHQRSSLRGRKRCHNHHSSNCCLRYPHSSRRTILAPPGTHTCPLGRLAPPRRRRRRLHSWRNQCSYPHNFSRNLRGLPHSRRCKRPPSRLLRRGKRCRTRHNCSDRISSVRSSQRTTAPEHGKCIRPPDTARKTHTKLRSPHNCLDRRSYRHRTSRKQ